MTSERITALFQKYYTQTATADEEAALFQWLSAAEDRQVLLSAMDDEWRKSTKLSPLFTPVSGEEVLKKILFDENTTLTTEDLKSTDNNLPASHDLPDYSPQSGRTVHRVHFLKAAWFRYAAVLLLIAGTATFLYIKNYSPQISLRQSDAKQDVLPGGNKAVLTLSDGSTITLDNSANGQLAQQGNSKVVKLANGQVKYETAGGHLNDGDKMIYNTVSTPKGGQYQVTLPDGSGVWLNAGSSIRFPVAFTKSREVAVTGELYFEIRKDTKRPFIVSTSGTEVLVLGTSLNINTYSDEMDTKTTLIEGSIKVISGQVSKLLKPGQQARTTGAASSGIQVQEADVSRVIAWKEGYFNFNRSDIKSMMREIGRWYDLEIIYETEPAPREIMGEMERNLKLSQILNILKKLHINYRVEGKKLIIME